MNSLTERVVSGENSPRSGRSQRCASGVVGGLVVIVVVVWLVVVG